MEKSKIGKLMELKQLYETGVLTKEEMEAEKAKILGKATPIDESPTLEIASDETQLSSTVSTTNKRRHRNYNKGIIGIVIIAVLIIAAIIVLNLNKQNESTSVSKEDVKLSQQTGVDSRNAKGEQETKEADMNTNEHSEGHKSDSQELVGVIDKNNAVKMPIIQDISRFSDDARNNYQALLEYGFTLVDRQSIIENKGYEDDNSEYELIKEVYSLKYNSDSRTSDIFDGNMTITCVYSEDYGEPCIKIECDKYSWKKLKIEADNYLKSFGMPETYWLNHYQWICFEHEGFIKITSDMSNCWE